MKNVRNFENNMKKYLKKEFSEDVLL